MLKISVVTICFNNLDELQDSMRSVDEQSLQPYEHIIIDGSSKPDIKEYLESHPQPSYRSWINERDKGISDAFNKGVRRATGDIIHLLNSGDQYYDKDILSFVAKTFETHPDVKWMHGKYLQYRGEIGIISGKPFEKDKLYRGMRQTAHPTMYIRKELYDKYGLFILEQRNSMDYDFLVRIRDEKFLFTDRILSRFAKGGNSEINADACLKEVVEIYTERIGPSMALKLWILRIKALNRMMKTGIGQMLFKMKNKTKLVAE